MGLTPARRVWLLVAALGAAAGGVWTLTPHAPAARPVSHSAVAWLVLAVACAVADAPVVHVNVGRSAHTFAFADITIVAGLFLVTPTTLVTARLVGAAAAYGLLHRQRPQKLAFNLAQFALGVTAATLIWQETGPHDLALQRSWLAAVAAVVTVAVVSSLSVSTVIRLDGGRVAPAAAARTIATSLATALTQAAFALVALCVARVSTPGLWAVAVVAGFLVLAQRSHIRLQRRHGALQRLNEVAARLNRDLQTQAIATQIVIGAVRTVDAAAAELELADDNGEVSLIRYDGSAVTALAPTSCVVEAVEGDAAPAADRVAVPVPLDGASTGTLRVAGSSAVRAFTDDDRHLLATLAEHAGSALANGRLADELRVQAAENEHQATHDALTGLPNRLQFDRVLSQLLAAGEPAAVLLFDLDRFKDVNDTLGHAAGDAMLADVGARLQSAVPQARCIARLGGDEFTMVIAPAGEAVARAAATAARAALLHPLQLRSVDVSVDASVGIALSPEHGTTTDELLRHADVAMYAAKAHRGAVTVYRSEIDHNDPSRLSLVADLRHAIDSGGLHLNYQPKIHLGPGRGAPSAEVLARWQHPDRGFVPPDEFIAIAEQTGLITPLTDWVVATALRQCRRWLDAGLDLHLAVNISARVLRDDQFPDRLAAALTAARVPAPRLTVEITETAIMDDITHTVEVLWRLRRLGVRVSVDDLGVGHSSLAYLKRLPVDEVKIDKSFVMTMADDPDDDAIVCAVVELAHRLRKSVVAEGVETQRVRDRLQAVGCDTAQGYYYSRPLPAADLPAWFSGQADVTDRRALRPVDGAA